VAVDDQLADVVLAGGDRVDALEQLARPALLRPVGNCVGANSAISTSRQTDRLRRFERANVLTMTPNAVSPAASSVPTTAATATGLPTAPTPCPRTQTYGHAHDERGDPQRQRREQLAGGQVGAACRRQQQALERPALALAAERVGGDEQRQQRADGDRHLDGQADRLVLFEEVQRLVLGGRGR
jgi:hypothetical protein